MGNEQRRNKFVDATSNLFINPIKEPIKNKAKQDQR